MEGYEVQELDVRERDPIIYEEMEVQKAINFIKRSRNRAIFICVGQFAKSKDQGDAPEDSIRGRSVCGSVRVSAPVAARFVQEAYQWAAEKGCTVQIGYCSNCLFVGRSA